MTGGGAELTGGGVRYDRRGKWGEVKLILLKGRGWFLILLLKYDRFFDEL